MGGDATRWDVRNGSGLWSTALSKTSGLTSSCVSAQSAGLELTYYLVYCGFDGLIFDRYGGGCYLLGCKSNTSYLPLDWVCVESACQ